MQFFRLAEIITDLYTSKNVFRKKKYAMHNNEICRAQTTLEILSL